MLQRLRRFQGDNLYMENLEMSWILTAVNEMSRVLLKVREVSGKNLVREKWPKTVYC